MEYNQVLEYINEDASVIECLDLADYLLEIVINEAHFNTEIEEEKGTLKELAKCKRIIETIIKEGTKNKGEKMNSKEFIKKLNFMINVGTDFDYKKEYKNLSIEDKKEVDEFLKKHEFTLN